MNANGLHAPICPVLTVAHPIEPVNPRCHIRLKENVIHHMKNFLPVQINCNMAEVHLTEVPYNGCWMYTAATIQLVNPEDTLFMPGSADINERYAAVLRKDGERIWRIAALVISRDTWISYVS